MNTKSKTWIRNGVAESLNPEIFAGFIQNWFPGFIIRNFIDPQEANEMAKRIDSFMEEYITAPGVAKAGPAMVDHGHDFDEYAKNSALWLDPTLSIPERIRLVNQVCGYLGIHTGMTIKPLVRENKRCFIGVFRKINTGAGAHLDILTEDSNAFSQRKTKFQASVVLHLEVPALGGETIIWDRTAQDGDKDKMIDSWQYDESLFKDIRSVSIPAYAGDLIILSTLNYHKVMPSIDPAANRISFSLFLMIFEDEPGTIYIYN